MFDRQLATPKAEGTRERILDAALALFREKGFDATTIRDVANAAGIATGGTYYYFRSKEELVMAFYLRTAQEMKEELPVRLNTSRDLRRRISMILEMKFGQFEQHRAFLGALFRVAVDPASPLSPFGKETRAIREEAVDWFRVAIEGSSTAIPRDLNPFLPYLMWMYQMGLILFWIYDDSPGQVKTRTLSAGTLDLIVRGIRMSSLPLMATMRRPAIKLLKELFGEDH